MNKHQDFLIKFVHIKFMKLKNDSINSKVSYKTQEGSSSPLQKYIIVNVNDLEYIYRYYHKHLSGKITSQGNSDFSQILLQPNSKREHLIIQKLRWCFH